MKKYLIMFGLVGGAISSNIACAAETSKSTAPYSGWFLGGGLNFQNTDTKAIVNDNLADAMDRHDILQNATNFRLFRKHSKHLGVSFVSGYGYLFSNSCYIGGEISVDLTKRRKYSVKAEPYDVSSIENGVFVPTFAFRCGMYSSQLDALIYFKLGRTCLNNKIKNTVFRKAKIESRKFSDVLGIGIEKSISSKNTIRLELDYRLSANKLKSNLSAYNPLNGELLVTDFPYHGQVKNKSRGFCARIIFSHYF